jgi:hypothetical protein
MSYKIINDVETSFQETEEELKDISGFLYCLFNAIFKIYGNDYFKLGKAFDVEKRLASYSTYYPELSEMLEVSSKFRNRHLAERVLFKKLAPYRDKQKREFFKCSTKLIKNAFDEIEFLFLKYTDIEIAEIFSVKLTPNKKKKVAVKNDDIVVTEEEYDICDDDDDESDDIIDGGKNDVIVDKNDNDININIIINGDRNVSGNINKKSKKHKHNNYCEKCKTQFTKKYNYDQHVKRKTPCGLDEKEEYELGKRSCQYCPKVLASVHGAKVHMTSCKYKPNDVEKLTQLVMDLKNQMNNLEKKPTKKISNKTILI